MPENFIPVKADLTDPSSLESRLVKIMLDVKTKGLRLSALINNAGYVQIGAIEDVPVELVRKQFETNVFELLAITGRVIPIMRNQGGGKIVNVGSVAGLFAGPLGRIYSATKHSLEALNAAMRMELKNTASEV